MPSTAFRFPEKYTHQNGFGSYHECVNLDGAAPKELMNGLADNTVF